MPLFQQSVIKKHIESFDKNHIEERWQLFRGIFHTAEKQQNIRKSKEEQYQEGFLRDLFVTVLGYTINPEVNFNLLTEQKNVNNSKKADGAIILQRGDGSGSVVAVIELKGTETTDLNKIEIQAFGYKNNQPGCNYVITSNFEKLRFYIDNTTQQEEFNLFTLTKAQFELLYACLAWQSISKNKPMQILNESVSKENIITKSLYKDYSEFKRALFANLVEMNPQYDKLVLFKKTQKLLDRFLFIFFAEDRLLLPTNLIFRINKEWENIIAQRIQVSLYDRYKMYFNDLNVGAKVTLPAFGKKTGEAITAEFEIFAYNGGLFQPDDLLDNIQIEDTLLHSYTQKMSHYNFESDVDVNILGHIFENSLNEIDEIKSEIEGNVLEKTKTRRKKDGVFYTPKYITKYIVDNTIGKLCTEKKDEIGLRDEDYVLTMLDGRSSHYDLSKAGSTPEDVERQSRRRSREAGNNISKAKKKALLDKLSDYRNWLLDLTICDPACGSGAFLNQALEFLIAEHRYVDELQAKLMGDSLILSDVENSILENNIYGVDLNDESVEIAKLSLWLRTAQKGRKLNSLNNNIKCGNSLIDDVAVAGDKAFSWEKEFPEVFKEKNKFAYHITTAVHDSRTSQRMIDYKARERRFEGTKPEAEVFPISKNEEEIIANVVSDIVKEDKLNIMAFNICWDHMHILLISEEEDVPKIMQKIKAKTARAVNIYRGVTTTSREHAPLADKEDNAPLADKETPTRGEKQNSLWTQKYGCKPINDDDHLWNTLNYIDDNRAKHNLPNNPKLKTIIAGFVKTYEDCFKPEYKGGFDVVIGNPPYVQIKNSINYFSVNYKTVSSGDLYSLFYEKSISILVKSGMLGFITPSSYMTNIGFISLREELLKHNITQLIDLGANVFKDASVDSAIIVIENNYNKENRIQAGSSLNSLDYLSQSIFNEFSNKILNIYLNPQGFELCNRIEKENYKFDDYLSFSRGVEFGFKSEFVFDQKINENAVPILCGGNIAKQQIAFENKYIQFDHNDQKIYKNRRIYDTEKILVKRIGNTIIGSYDDKGYFNVCDVYNLQLKTENEYSLKAISSIINSRFINYYYDTKFKSVKKLFPKIPIQSLKLLPIPMFVSGIDVKLDKSTSLVLFLRQELQNHLIKFVKYFATQYQIEKLPSKLQKWYELEFADFIKELNKAIKGVKGTALTKKDEFEWMDLFEENKKKALELKAEIDKTDREIDQMVYALYELTEEEIRIVEGE